MNAPLSNPLLEIHELLDGLAADVEDETPVNESATGLGQAADIMAESLDLEGEAVREAARVRVAKWERWITEVTGGVMDRHTFQIALRILYFDGLAAGAKFKEDKNNDV